MADPTSNTATLSVFVAASNVYAQGIPLVIRSGDERPIRHAVTTDTATDIVLPTGRYHVEAELPSGRVVEDDVELVASGATLRLEAPGERSNEWRAWPNLYGTRRVGPESSGPTRGGSRGVTNRSVNFERLENSFHGSFEVFGAKVDPTTIASTMPESPVGLVIVGKKETRYVSFDDASERTVGRQGLKLVIERSEGEDGTGSIVVHTRSTPWFDDGAFFENERFFLAIDEGKGGPPGLVALPIGWTNSFQPSDIQILLPGDDDPPGVYVHDPALAAALGRLASGNNEPIEQSRQLVRDAVDGLAGKLQNPLRAAAAAYILLRAHAHEDLRDWPGNLARHFPWLPDGCIAHATQVLETSRDGSRREEALRWLVNATHHGIPYYTEGVRLLVQGLRRAAPRSQSEDVRKALAFAERLELAAAPDTLMTWLNGIEAKAITEIFGP